MITELQPNEVFVFGSNEQGFHGAGTAGLACRGDARNTWRSDAWFQAAMKAPVGSPARIGKWAIFGVARGFQVGTEGRSYAIATVTKPGARRSVSRRDVYYQLDELWAFAKAHPELTFWLTRLGQGYAGWTNEEMQVVWNFLELKLGWPSNVKWADQTGAKEHT